MDRIKALGIIVLCLTIVIILFGCQTTGRTAGQFIDDVGIAATIQAKYLDDPDLSPFKIQVTSYQGEVTLTGAVDSPKAKRKAEKIAYSVRGVTKVNNHIKIQ